jgi:tetratricopeptide (TPR) repeat protein
LTRVISRPTAEAYNTLGALYAKENKLSCAIPAFEQALSFDSQDWRARYNLALALLQAGEEKMAVEHLHILIQQKPDSAVAHNVLGTVFQRQGKLEEATEEFKAALKIEPGLVVAGLNLGQILIAQKRYQAAMVYLEDTLKSSPPPDLEERLRSTLGVAQAENGDSDLAINTLEQVIKSHPNAADAYFNLATVYAKKGLSVGYAKAIANFEEALRIDPHYYEARYSLAKVLVEAGQFSKAVSYLSAYTHNQPHEAEGFHLLGSAYVGLSQLDKAAEALELAMRLKPDDYEIRCDLGSVLAKAGKTDGAIEQLKMAEKINPHFADTHYQLALQLRKKGDRAGSEHEMQAFQALKDQENLEVTGGNLNNEGNRLLQEGKAQEAVEAYRKAVAFDPTNAQWHYNLSLALARLRDTEGEKEALTKALALNPNMANAHNDLGLLYLSEDKLQEAEKEFHAALNIDPRSAEALNNLGVVYTRQGKDSEASALFRQAAENDPGYTKALVNLGLVKAQQGNLPAAEQQIQEALKISSNNIDALTTLGMIEGKMGHSQESVRVFRKVTSLNPSAPDGHLNLGIALADQYDLRGALQEFSEAIRLAPNYAVAYYNKGRVLYDLGRGQEAQPFLETACKLQPNYPNSLYLLAVILGVSPRATEVLKQLVTVNPENAEAHSMLAQALLREGDTQGAIAHWKTAVKLDPQNSSSLYNLARALSKANDPEAKEYMDRFQELHKTVQLTDRVRALNNFALTAANAHNWPKAVEQLQESIRICGQCKELPALHRNLGLIYARTGDLQEAERELETALSIDPHDTDAQKALQMLRSIPQQSDSSAQ